jgi:hypothetical protein
MFRSLLSALLLLTLLSGCAVSQRARTLMKAGEYDTALDWYDALVKQYPEDASLRAERDEARHTVLRAWVERAGKLRSEGKNDASVKQLLRALAQRQAWGLPAEPTTQWMLDSELNAQMTPLRQQVATQLAAGSPLEARAALETWTLGAQVAELAPLLAKLDTEVRESGRARCAALTQASTPAEPFWTWLVGRYCAQWNEAGPKALPLPEVSGALALEVQVPGVEAPRVEVLRQTLQRAAERSPYFLAGAPGTLWARAEGTHASKEARMPVMLQHHYTVNVPYTAWESHRVSRQVPYTATESYTYSCGSNGRTCHGTRSVTRYRTEYHTEQRPVTRYRAEPRTHSYPAVAVTVNHQTSLMVQAVPVAGLAPLRVEEAKGLEKTGTEHQELFGEGNLSPQRADVPSGSEWFDARAEALGNKLAAALRDSWEARFCVGEGTPNREQAARCAYAGKTWPPAVRQSLEQALGGDAVRLAPRLARQ